MSTLEYLGLRQSAKVGVQVKSERRQEKPQSECMLKLKMSCCWQPNILGKSPRLFDYIVLEGKRRTHTCTCRQKDQRAKSTN